MSVVISTSVTGLDANLQREFFWVLSNLIFHNGIKPEYQQKKTVAFHNSKITGRWKISKFLDSRIFQTWTSFCFLC